MANEMANKNNNNNNYSQKPKDKDRRVVSWPERHEVWEYAEELSSFVDPDKFYDYYNEREWQTASGPVYDWKALFRSWDKNEYRKSPKKKLFSYRYGDQPVSDEALKAFMEEDQQEHLNKVLEKLKKAGNANAQ